MPKKIEFYSHQSELDNIHGPDTRQDYLDYIHGDHTQSTETDPSFLESFDKGDSTSRDPKFWKHYRYKRYDAESYFSESYNGELPQLKREFNNHHYSKIAKEEAEPIKAVEQVVSEAGSSGDECSDQDSNCSESDGHTSQAEEIEVFPGGKAGSSSALPIEQEAKKSSKIATEKPKKIKRLTGEEKKLLMDEVYEIARTTSGLSNHDVRFRLGDLRKEKGLSEHQMQRTYRSIEQDDSYGAIVIPRGPQSKMKSYKKRKAKTKGKK